jgi:galactose mutarotase-like enzyme
MIELKNIDYSATISPLGAELKSLIHNSTQTELMWQGNPEWWGRTAPVLFPIVGKLKDNQYNYQNKNYELSQHGFARDLIFEVEESKPETATFVLYSNEETKAKYPFDFKLTITYILDSQGLTTQYKVENISADKDLYFSIGAHPAFNLPFIADTQFSEHSIRFQQPEDLVRFKLENGLISNNTLSMGSQTQTIPFNPDLFIDDALVFKNLKSEYVEIVHQSTQNSIRLTAKNFPFYGIWQKHNAPFVCLEPWCGIADSIYTHGDITHKEGINKLSAGEKFDISFSISFITYK